MVAYEAPLSPVGRSVEAQPWLSSSSTLNLRDRPGQPSFCPEAGTAPAGGPVTSRQARQEAPRGSGAVQRSRHSRARPLEARVHPRVRALRCRDDAELLEHGQGVVDEPVPREQTLLEAVEART